MYKHHLQHGHVPDTLYDELGFAEDVDPSETVVRRDSNTEHLQRAKTLSHSYQRKLRLEYKQEMEEKAAAKAIVIAAKTQKILDVNKQCETKLCLLSLIHI